MLEFGRPKYRHAPQQIPRFVQILFPASPLYDTLLRRFDATHASPTVPAFYTPL
jgi:hypothetical protein